MAAGTAVQHANHYATALLCSKILRIQTKVKMLRNIYRTGQLEHFLSFSMIMYVKVMYCFLVENLN